jgi:hypothetical protein
MSVTRWCKYGITPKAGTLFAISRLTGGEVPVEAWDRYAA